MPELVLQTPPAPGNAFSSTLGGGPSGFFSSYGAMSVGGVDGAGCTSSGGLFLDESRGGFLGASSAGSGDLEGLSDAETAGVKAGVGLLELG